MTVPGADGAIAAAQTRRGELAGRRARARTGGQAVTVERLANALGSQARGVYAYEAAVSLLVEHGS